MSFLEDFPSSAVSFLLRKQKLFWGSKQAFMKSARTWKRVPMSRDFGESSLRAMKRVVRRIGLSGLEWSLDYSNVHAQGVDNS
ncbi:hypothetical protein CEXT_618711 [Caerostris extrusa]|uniref:Uncharacterized protein n=1 Tax=Caerostris extrusa TaxID=172846 RepID=A0AAV4X074_CAEEX|nr:hypothetical protein CEXT_618711 [Caerostris extrusa]